MFNSITKRLEGLFRWRIKPQDAPPDTTPSGSYGEKLLKYIPADIVAGWVALSGILVQSAHKTGRCRLAILQLILSKFGTPATAPAPAPSSVA
jgi:hypothetical protein